MRASNSFISREKCLLFKSCFPYRLELDNMAAFLRGAVEYKKKIGFTGNLLLEPKPQVLTWNTPSNMLAVSVVEAWRTGQESLCCLCT